MQQLKWSRVFLGLNAVFSIVTGLALIFMSEEIGQLMLVREIDWMPPLIVITGVCLILFAISLIVLVRDKLLTKPKVMAIAAADVGWVVSSCVALVLFSEFLTTKGVTMISSVAFVVMIFAIGQAWGTRAPALI